MSIRSRIAAALAAVCLAIELAAQVPTSTPAATPAPSPTPAVPMAYRAEPLGAGELPKRFTPIQIGILEKLNRRDAAHLARLTELIVPGAWTEDELAYSPLPAEWAWAASHPKALIVHQPAQVFGAYEFGRLVRWGPVSTGRKETPTPAGSFNLTWRSKSRRSTDNEAWLLNWYFNFINSRGISFHEFDLPGAAASHACVRLLTRDAMWIYGWGEQWKLSADRRTVDIPGTPVVVQGVVDSRNPTPWTTAAYWSVPLTLISPSPGPASNAPSPR